MKNSVEEDIKMLEEFSNENILYGSTVAMPSEKYKALQLSAEHILLDYKSVLKGNGKLKKHNNALVKKIKNRVKQIEKLEKYGQYKKEFSRLNKQLQDKNKIIDLMAGRLAINDIGLCLHLAVTTKCERGNGKTCKECIKQYFENKTKEEK